MALSKAYWAMHVDGHRKLTRKSEAAVESDRVLAFVFDKDCRVIHTLVQASMRDTSYKVQVSSLHMYTSRSCHFVVQMFGQFSKCYQCNYRILADTYDTEN